MFENAKNSKVRGTIGVGVAISFYTKKGFVVLIPINDSQEYDLVIENEEGLRKVSVKTVSHSKNEKYICSISTNGGNQSFNTIKKFEKTFADLLFILAENGDCWEIPVKEIDAGRALVLGDKWIKYKINE